MYPLGALYSNLILVSVFAALPMPFVVPAICVFQSPSKVRGTVNVWLVDGTVYIEFAAYVVPVVISVNVEIPVGKAILHVELPLL